MIPSQKPFPQYTNSCIFLFLAAIFCLQLLCGCEISKEKDYDKEEAEREFLRICRQEYDYDLSTRLTGNTLWIYLPFKSDVLRFTASRFAQENKCVAAYVEGNFNEQRFYLDYEIVDLFKPPEDTGVTHNLFDTARDAIQNLQNTIFRVYFNSDTQPEFYAIVISDIKNGVELIQIINHEDLVKAFNYVIVGEEFNKRALFEVKGDLFITNDETGRHIDYREIAMTEFLAKQITQRIRNATSEPLSLICEDTQTWILETIAYCFDAYDFKNIDSVTINNLSTGEKIVKDWIELEEYLDDFREF